MVVDIPETPSSAAATFNVLIAGFGPFSEGNGTFTDNPAAQTALALDNQCFSMEDLVPDVVASSRVCFLGWNLSVSHVGASEVERSLHHGAIQRAGIDAIVHLGLENSALGLKIEVTGANIMAEPQVPGEKIQPWAPDISPATLDLSRLEVVQQALQPIVDAENAFRAARGRGGTSGNKTVGEAWSRDAGTFYCNEALWRTTNAVRTLRVLAPGSQVTPPP